MITEKEYTIMKALIEEEIQDLEADSELCDHAVVVQYLDTLSGILQKLKVEDAIQRFSMPERLVI